MDLRWGITEEESRDGKTLEICLEEVDRSRPFFIGIVGNRYGWADYTIPDKENFQWIPDGLSLTATEIFHGVLNKKNIDNKAFFYFRQPDFISSIPSDLQKEFLPENQESEQKINRLKQLIIDKGHKPFLYSCEYDGLDEDGNVKLKGLDEFGNRIVEDLWSEIKRTYGNQEASNLTTIYEYESNFIYEKRRTFLGREKVIEQIEMAIENDTTNQLLITGDPGSGKSSLMAVLISRFKFKQTDSIILHHFIGVSPGSTELSQILVNLYQQLSQNLKHKVHKDFAGYDLEKVKDCFLNLVKEVEKNKRIILFFDALNQININEQGYLLNWIFSLPKHIKVVMSTLRGSMYNSLMTIKPVPTSFSLPLLDQMEQNQLVTNTLVEYRKPLSTNQMNTLLEKRDANNPLYLVLASEELRLYGKYISLNQKIKTLPETVKELFSMVLRRLEEDYGTQLVKSSMSLIACSRNGLLEIELKELLGPNLPWAAWARLYFNLRFYLRPVDENGEGLLYFFHEQLYIAIKDRYLSSSENELPFHKALATYFLKKAGYQNNWTGKDPRAFEELLFYLIKANMTDEIKMILFDLTFLEKIFEHGLFFELKKRIHELFDSSRIPKEDVMKIRQLYSFLIKKAHILIERASLLFQEAANMPKDFILYDQAVRILASSKWLKHQNQTNFFQEPIAKIKGHITTRWKSMTLSPGGKWVVTLNSNSSSDYKSLQPGIVKVFSESTGEEVLSTDEIIDYQLSAAGNKLFTLTSDSELECFNLENAFLFYKKSLPAKTIGFFTTE